ncbi:aldehyde dehydrogenase (NADP(+)) [Sphingomonas oryzagri]|uniref:Aldehyde dehydrogenase (NADP(+)) n=1 Tax=Sphingomonas oryzagri TaxID=3042314 RepID=A0ABT6N1Z9_9SPHN|nr:aldehyde dehydrogenase (NADP(+)) [Sphingomonas oryzagri]MDH7639315.1 aldehyde dehydrogenase (NADP(+)) [Sphingomonas oryzagri]
MDGSFLVGGTKVSRPETFQASDPATGALLATEFSVSSAADVARACALADEALDSFRELAPEDRATFLETVASQIEQLGDTLIERAHAESGLTEARLNGERGRTCGQLRLFARVVRDGYWAGASIDPALPERTPLPRSDLRLRRIPVGPVAVFGASNFPLAFSVAGGDTASAWAAGCPVVVKGHPAHPGTSLLVGDAIRRAVEICGLHEGVFSLLQGASNNLGTSLVSNPHIKAVGFTGSRAGGLALLEIASTRPEPIPVFAEMSSVNPVILFPQALEARGAALGAAFVASLTMGSGQFCTNPGILLAVEGEGLDAFVGAAVAAIEGAQPQVMLTSAIHANFDRGVAALENHESVRLLARGAVPTGCNRGQAALFETSGAEFLKDYALGHEIFGAASLLVRCADLAEIASVIEVMEGQLTATLQIDAGDHEAARDLMPLLERKVGRILANGWPTGVEVCNAMVHGGPFPATSDSRTTSVGATAIDRFLRPVCYQDLPDEILPAVLRDANPLNMPRLREGTPD